MSADGEGGGGGAMSVDSSPVTEFSPSSSVAGEDFVEVTLDIEDNDTIVLRSVEPATIFNVEPRFEADTPASTSRSPSSSSRLRMFSQELKSEAVNRAKQFSQELRRFSWGRGHAARILAKTTSSQSAPQNAGGGGPESAIATRSRRRQLAQLNRTRSGAKKALRGLRFISSKSNSVDAWNEVESNFEKLSKDGYLFRADFALCIGSNPHILSLSLFPKNRIIIDLIADFLLSNYIDHRQG